MDYIRLHPETQTTAIPHPATHKNQEFEKAPYHDWPPDQLALLIKCKFLCLEPQEVQAEIFVDQSMVAQFHFQNFEEASLQRWLNNEWDADMLVLVYLDVITLRAIVVSCSACVIGSPCQFFH